MIQGLFIIRIPSGQLIFEKYFTDFQTDGNIFCGIITALKLLTREVHFGELSQFSTNNFQVIFSSLKNFLTVLILELQDNIDSWQQVAFQVSKEFEEKYGDLDDWNGNLSKFQEFNPNLEEILKEQSYRQIIEIGQWAAKEFDGELHVIDSDYVDIILDKGDKEIFRSYKVINFIKLIEEENIENPIKNAIEFCKSINPLNHDRDNMNLISHFPSKMIFMLKKEPIYTKENLIRFLMIDDKNENYFIPNDLEEGEIQSKFFKCYVEFWKWNPKQPIQIDLKLEGIKEKNNI